MQTPPAMEYPHYFQTEIMQQVITVNRVGLTSAKEYLLML